MLSWRSGRRLPRSIEAGSRPLDKPLWSAARFRARVRDFVDLLHVYPTMAEALKIVAISRYKDPAKLSCCAE